MTARLNPFLAWLLAFAIAALPCFAIGWAVVRFGTSMAGYGEMAMWGDGLFPVWGSLGLALTALLIRPIENAVRKWGYGLASVETANGLASGEDRVSAAAGDALTRQFAGETGQPSAAKPGRTDAPPAPAADKA